MKRVIILFLFLILGSSLVLAADINIDYEIPQGQTIIASISGNFYDAITKDDISFYRGHVRTSFDYDITKMGDDYYLYVQTINKNEATYSVNITGVRYFVNSQISDEQISKGFKIINETSDFYVDPGFIIIEDNSLIALQNLLTESLDITINSEIDIGDLDGSFKFIFENEEVNSLTLSPEEADNLHIQVESFSETSTGKIILDSTNTKYEIPFYFILKNTTNGDTEDNETIVDESNLDEEECSFLDILLGGCGEETTTNEDEDETDKNASSSEEEDEDETDDSGVDYEIVEEGEKTIAVKDGEVISESATSKTCSEMKGRICSDSQVCQNATVYAKDAKCCISKCVEKEKGINTKLIGWVMIVILVLIVIRFFAVKFKGVKNKKDPLLGSRK